jgi:hypothetical protein
VENCQTNYDEEAQSSSAKNSPAVDLWGGIAPRRSGTDQPRLDNLFTTSFTGRLPVWNIGRIRPQPDGFEKIEHDIDKTRRRRNEFIDDTSVTRPIRLSLRTLRDSTSFAFAQDKLCG